MQDITQGVRANALQMQGDGESLAVDAVKIVGVTSTALEKHTVACQSSPQLIRSGLIILPSLVADNSAISHQQLVDGYSSYDEEAVGALQAVRADLLSTKEDIATTVMEISLSVRRLLSTSSL